MTRTAIPLYDTLQDHQANDAPQISPPGGTGSEEMWITIAHPLYWHDGGLHYTIDGTTPTLSSPVYSGPFAAVKGMTVEARIRRGGQRRARRHGAIRHPRHHPSFHQKHLLRKHNARGDRRLLRIAGKKFRRESGKLSPGAAGGGDFRPAFARCNERKAEICPAAAGRVASAHHLRNHRHFPRRQSRRSNPDCFQRLRPRLSRRFAKSARRRPR